MSALGGFGRWLGGGLLFIGLLLFITMYAANASGILSSQYLNNAIGQIANASANQASLPGQGQSASNITNILNSFLSKNPNCNLLCLAMSPLESITNMNVPISTSSGALYQLLSEIAIAAGAILIFLSYEGAGSKFAAAGRTSLSAAIISFVSTYIPIMFILPYLLSFQLYGVTIKIPASILAPFTGLVLSLDIIVGIVGIVLILIRYIFFRKPKQQKLQQMLSGR